MVKKEKNTHKEIKTSSFQKMQNELGKVIEAIEPGEKLPSEPALAKTLGISRATLREAMRTFEAQGLIRRRQGVGTFVVAPGRIFETGLEVLESIESLSHKMGLTVTMGELSIEYQMADDHIANKLGIAPGSAIVHVSRVIYSENRPVAFLIDILPEGVISQDDLKSEFRGSVLDRLIATKSADISHSQTYIHAVAASSSIARSLEIQRGDVLLLFEAFLQTEQGDILDYSFSYFLPGYFRFKVIRSVTTNSSLI